jgi:hypothetical protein
MTTAALTPNNGTHHTTLGHQVCQLLLGNGSLNPSQLQQWQHMAIGEILQAVFAFHPSCMIESLFYINKLNIVHVFLK